MKIIGIGLCLIGIGIIVNALAVKSVLENTGVLDNLDNTAKVPGTIPKGKPAGEYDPDEGWEFPED